MNLLDLKAVAGEYSSDDLEVACHGAQAHGALRQGTIRKLLSDPTADRILARLSRSLSKGNAMNPSILKRLRLSGLTGSLEARLQEAASSRLTHAQFLELVVQDELAVRAHRLIVINQVGTGRQHRSAFLKHFRICSSLRRFRFLAN